MTGFPARVVSRRRRDTASRATGWWRLLVAVAMALGTAVVLPVPADAATIDTTAYYQVVSRSSGKALAVQDGSTADQAQIVQYTTGTATSQQWQFVDSGGGYYRLRARHSGKVVDVAARSTADGAKVVQYTDNNGANQQFKPVDTDSGYVKLVNRNSGKVLDVYGRSTAEGAVISQYTDNNGANQQWRLMRVDASSAHNPALPGYNADPQVRYLAGQYWIYPTSDGYADWGSTKFTAYSSPDLVNWTDHGVVLDLANVSWCHARAWAPTIAYRDGTYWLYFSACQQIGVARSTSPSGPFTDALDRPLVSTGQYGEQEIDPDVFTDDDGTAYLYFGSGNAEVARLSASMTAFATAPARITPASFREASNVFKRNGTYYLMYSENDTRSEDYRVDYATSASPLGPFTKAAGSPVLSKDTGAGILGTGHSSVVKVPGRDEWYIAYHRFRIPGGDGTHREVCIDAMTFASDGSVNRIRPTLTGIAPVAP
ncbi:family 43 glycosylhydrolase [Sphaerisporangium sp. NPDC005289]|uniref:family 43 glycosylhydrolase n=1 Tax=Sphaerisporangium sp. NPDC005289 TaxID=3155247 RepID=UPI0033B3E9A3